MSTYSYNWILPFSVLVLTGFGSAIVSLLVFYRYLQTRINLICSIFVIPLIITVYSFVFQNSFSVSNAIALGEIAMIVMGIVISTVIKYKIRVKTTLFVSALIGIALCVVLSHIHLFSFLIQELRVYLTMHRGGNR
jgi:MFS-type transporter involved in bile tolerance (Atg22 family)